VYNYKVKKITYSQELYSGYEEEPVQQKKVYFWKLSYDYFILLLRELGTTTPLLSFLSCHFPLIGDP